MDKKGLDKTSRLIIDFLDGMNRSSDYCYSCPIVAFQFVSLNESDDGKLTWWTAFKPKIGELYKSCIKEFTGLAESGKISNTLIFDEPINDVYWHKSYTNSLQQWENVGFEIDKDEDHINLGSEEVKAHKSSDSTKIDKWRDVLLNKFDNSGETMWISLPHTHRRYSQIHSSVFVLFSTDIGDKSKRNRIYKKIRNFIIDYLIGLYRGKVADEVEMEMKELTKLSLNDFKLPNYYVRSPSQKNLQVIEDFENRFFDKQNSPEQYLEIYRPLINYFRDDFDGKQPFSKSYTAFAKFIDGKIVSQAQFEHFLRGRLFFLVLHIVFNYSCEKSIQKMKELYKTTEGFDTLGEINKKLRLLGVKNDLGTRKTNDQALVPKISVAEKRIIKILFNLRNENPFHRHLYD